MPTATLKHPRSLRMGSQTFLKGVETRISPSQIPALELDDRFELDTTDVSRQEVQDAVQKASDAKTKAVKKPADPNMIVIAIQKAYQGLDHEDESNFTKDGKPDCRVLAKVIGYGITKAERDEALGYDGEDEKTDVKPATKTEDKTTGATDGDVKAPVKKPTNLKLGSTKKDDAGGVDI